MPTVLMPVVVALVVIVGATVLLAVARRPGRGPVAALAVAVLVAGCAEGADGDDGGAAAPAPPPAPTTAPTTAPSPSPTTTAPGLALGPEPVVSVVAEGLEIPWSLAFLPDGRVVVSERASGAIREVAADGSTTVVHELDVDPAGEGGLLGLAASPTFAEDGLIYAYLTTGRDNRIVRFGLGGPEEPVLTGIPAGAIHNGGRIAFGPDGLLYAGTGDAGDRDLAQDPSSLAGKVLRMAPDGSVPAGNPFAGSLVWSLGHRNVQGLAWTADGTLHVTELGPDRDDEINVIEPGANYGWPVVTGVAGRARFRDPLVALPTSAASWSGAVIPEGPSAGAWRGDLLAASLRGEVLWRLDLGPDGGLVGREPLFEGEHGRLRLAAQAPDGSIWLLTSNRDGRGRPGPTDDRILRVVPPAA